MALECDWSLWEVLCPLCAKAGVPWAPPEPVSVLGQEGTGALLQFELSRTQMCQCWMPRAQGGAPAPSPGWLQPLGIATRGSMPGLHQALALFSVHSGSAL